MILDHELGFSRSQAITTTAASTNVVYLGPEGPNGAAIGAPTTRRLPIVIDVDEAFTADGAATLTIAVQSDDNEAFSSPTTHFQTSAIGKAALTAGSRHMIDVEIPWSVESYVRLNYTVATGPMTAGKLSAYVATAMQTNV